jgi:hypothetical protein
MWDIDNKIKKYLLEDETSEVADVDCNPLHSVIRGHVVFVSVYDLR